MTECWIRAVFADTLNTIRAIIARRDGRTGEHRSRKLFWEFATELEGELLSVFREVVELFIAYHPDTFVGHGFFLPRLSLLKSFRSVESLVRPLYPADRSLAILNDSMHRN